MKENDSECKLVIFSIDEEEYGIFIEKVREIVRTPRIVKVPGTPPYIRGIVNLRGNVIPVIDSKARFDNSRETKVTEQTRMIVTETEGAINGLIIDSVKSVSSINRNAIEPPPETIKNDKSKYVDGVVKLNNGKQIVLILNLKEMFRISSSIVKGKRESSEARIDKTEKKERKKIEEQYLVTFRAGKEEYAFDIAKVREIIRLAEIVKVPDAPDYIMGILSLRDTLLPVIDFRSYIELESFEQEEKTKIKGIRRAHGEWLDAVIKCKVNGGKCEVNLNPGDCKVGSWIRELSKSNLLSAEIFSRLKNAHNKFHGRALMLLKKDFPEGSPVEELFRRDMERFSTELEEAFVETESAILKGLSENQKIVVVQSGKHTAGIIVDSVNEVLRVEKDLIDKTSVYSSKDDAEISGVVKLDNGERLIMIINESTFFEGYKEEFFEKMEEESVGKQFEQEKTEIEQFVAFTIEKEEFGISILQVQEINRVGKITKLPRAPNFIEGVINLRGEVIPVIDLRKRFEIRTKEIDDNSRVIIVDVSGKKTGLIVDRVNEVLRLGKDKIEPTPEVISAGAGTEFIKAVGKLQDGDRMIMILDINKLLTKSESREYLDMKVELGEKEGKKTEEKKTKEKNKVIQRKELKIEE